MATQIPIGTRGTIGSLVRREINYFNTCHDFDSRRDNRQENTNGGFQQRDRSSRLSYWFTRTNWRKKKRPSRGGRFLPSMCSMVDVYGENRIPNFKYRILKSDEKGLHV
ncbi:unnamed protein product [Cochlearia groenlandica]